MIKREKSEYTIGIDIGGTKMSAALFDGKRVIADYKLATPKEDLNKFTVMLSALIEPLRDRAQKDKIKIKGIGIGIPGIVDVVEGKIIKCNNIPLLNGIKIINLIKEKIDSDSLIAIDNDSNCFARAEALMGAGKKYSNIYGVIVGTGIGAGWWINQNIYQGGHGTAGEPGSMVIDFNTGMNLETAYHKLTQSNPAILAEEAYKGDVLAEKSFNELGTILGIAFANIANLIDPEIIIVGGGATRSSDLFLPRAKKIFKQTVVNPKAKEIKIVTGKLGELSGAIGAALLI